MSRILRQIVVGSLALAVVVVSAQSSFAGHGHHGHHGHHRHHRHHYIYRAPVRRVVYKAPPVVVVPAPVVAVRPIAPKPQLPSVPAGSTLTLPGNFLGTVPGNVFMVLDHVKLPAQIINWTPNGVTITLPPMAVKHPTPVRLDVILPHGQAINKVEILLTPPAPLVLHPTAPISPLPTAAAIEAINTPQIGAPVVQNAL